MKRTSITRAGVAIAAALLIVGTVGCASADESPEAGEGSTLRYGFLGNGTEYPADEVGWGLHTGIIQEKLAEAGIDDIEFSGVGTGPELNDALIGGKIDAASYGDNPGTIAKANGAPTRLLGFNSVKRESIFFTTPDGPSSVAELEGKTVGTVIGSYMHRSLTAYLQSEGVEVEWVQGEDSSLLASGAIDAIGTWDGNPEFQSLIDDEGYQLLFTTADAPDYRASLITVATEEFVSAHPGFPAAWREARAAAAADLLANEDDFYAWSAELLDAPEDVARTVFKTSQIALGTDEEFETGVDGLEHTQQVLIGLDTITTEFLVGEWYAE